MLICWLKDESIESFVSLALKENWIISDEEIMKTKHRFPNLCYGAYDDDKFVGGITGYLHEKSAWIGNFVVEPSYRGQGAGRALFETLLKALKLERESIYLHAAHSAVGFYEKQGFRAIGEVTRLICEGIASGKNEKTFLSDYQHQDSFGTMCSFDRKFFGESREDFLLHDMNSKSSLLLTCPNGFCHSKAVGKDIMIGAWEMVDGAYLDAERMLRSVLSVRGQKNIYVDTPKANGQIISMLESYGFKQSGGSAIMVHGKALDVRYENIFAFGSLGSKG